ncbi:MAG: site-specific integrase [Deltaproteobacteria bacterium]|nr:site-specific integrase [Deltaproteobacteria bacterium]
MKREIPRLNEFAKEFIEKYAKVRNKPSTIHSKEAELRLYIRPALGKLKLDDIRIREIDGMIADLISRGLSAKSVNNVLATLGKMLRYAEEIELLPKAPRIKLLKVPPSDYDFLDFDEADRLLVSTFEKEPQWYPLVLTMLRTGMRFGEASELRWRDVDLVAGKILVRRNHVRGHVGTPKSGKSREIPLSPQTVEVLKKTRHLKGDLVFCYENGSRLDYHRMNEVLWRLCRRAGLREINWHTCRHTFASHLVMRGESLKAAQELLGHSTIEMTMRYAHLAPVVMRDAVAKLDSPVIGLRLPGANFHKTECN